MRFIFTVACIFLSSFSFSQKLTGIWRGYFLQQGGFNPLSGEFMEDRYKFEVQINQLPDNSLEGVTYSYKTTVFYGKAMFHGILKKETKSVLIKELKMLELKMTDNSNACAMTCYLDYAKEGNKQTLTGTFTSLNVQDKTNCGEGTVYLEKVAVSDFKKENFLLKKEISNTNKTTAPKKTVDANAKKNSVATVPKKPLSSTQKEVHAPAKPPVAKIESKTKPTLKPGAEAFVVKKNQSAKKDTVIRKVQPIIDSIASLPLVNRKAEPKSLAIPKILIERENNLVKTIQIDENEVQIDYYDNGVIDNDTITVYHNNVLAVNKGRLSYTPITLKIHLDEKNPTHEIITVAENLGDVPPNTALMVITAGKKRYEVFITSDEKTNAKVVLEYKAKAPVKVY